MPAIKKFILFVVFTTVVCATVYANWGSTRYGGEQFGIGKWGTTQDITATFWTTAYGTDWTVAYGTDWTVTYDTEVP
jgi:hypothetical protein